MSKGRWEHKTPKSLIHEPKGRDGDFLSLGSVDLLRNMGNTGARLTAANRAVLWISQQRWSEIYRLRMNDIRRAEKTKVGQSE